MLPCVVCSFKAISEKHLRMHMQTSMMIVWEPVRSVTNLAKEGGSLRRTWILTGKVAANTVERRSHTIVQPVMWQSVLERSNSNVKIALLSLTQRGIWKCMWPAKVVQCSATVVTKPWKTQVIWTDTWLQFTVFKSSSCQQKCMRSTNACICKKPYLGVLKLPSKVHL